MLPFVTECLHDLSVCMKLNTDSWHYCQVEIIQLCLEYISVFSLSSVSGCSDYVLYCQLQHLPTIKKKNQPSATEN